jgi:hypothetical protein
MGPEMRIIPVPEARNIKGNVGNDIVSNAEGESDEAGSNDSNEGNL